jgi:MGT family glycosyltransferase
VLYISLGTIFTDNPAFYRTCIEAFGDGAWQVAMTIGDLDPAALAPIPPRVDARPRFPQPAVLRHARAFISHAGMNSTMEALSYGVPLVCLPQMPEQAANADRVVERGLGERLAVDTLTSDILRRAVTRVTTDEQVRANLEHMQRAIRDAGGAERGATLIEGHLA